MICVQLRQERHEALEARLMPLLTELGLSWNPIYRYAAPNGAFRPRNLCRASTVPKTEMRPVEWEAPQFLYSASFRGLLALAGDQNPCSSSPLLAEPETASRYGDSQCAKLRW